MAKFKQKLQAHAMRRRGVGIKTIAEKLSVSKGIVSLWCRDISLTSAQQGKLRQSMIGGGHKGRMLGAEVNKMKREVMVNESNAIAKKLVRNLSQRDLLFLGLGLYWGEGSKNPENRFVIVNSDPHLLKVILKWLQEVMNISSDMFVPQIYINDQHQYRVEKILRFWATELKIPKKQFRRTIFIHVAHKKVYANHDTYMGVLHLYVRKSAALKYTTMGMLRMIQNQLVF